MTPTDPLALLMFALALRLIPRRAAAEAPWRWGVDLGLALLCGVGMMTLCDRWLAAFHLYAGDVTGSDFSRCCLSTDALHSPDRLHYPTSARGARTRR